MFFCTILCSGSPPMAIDLIGSTGFQTPFHRCVCDLKSKSFRILTKSQYRVNTDPVSSAAYLRFDLDFFFTPLHFNFKHIASFELLERLIHFIAISDRLGTYP